MPLEIERGTVIGRDGRTRTCAGDDHSTGIGDSARSASGGMVTGRNGEYADLISFSKRSLFRNIFVHKSTPRRIVEIVMHRCSR